MRFADARFAASIMISCSIKPVVDRFAVRLEHEHVRAADALAVAAIDLAVRERREHDVAERHLQVLGDLGRQLLVAAPRHEHEIASW